MIGGSAQEFLDTLSLGIEKEIIYRGRRLFIQGGIDKDVWEMTVAQWDPALDDYIWITKAATMKECYERFLKAPIFDGKTFWQAEPEIEWVSG